MNRAPLDRMARPGFRALAVVVWALTVASCGEPPAAEEAIEPAPPETRPPAAVAAVTVQDVVLVTIDTLRADALGFAGNGKAETPTLDRLANAGWIFDQAHAHNVVTLPSHANILTGRYPFDHGVRDNTGFVLPGDVPTAATLLGEAGFATAAFVAAFPLDARYGLGRGFDVYDDQLPATAGQVRFRSTERSGDAVIRQARAWWTANAGHRRFLWVHLFEPHAPYEPPPDLATRFADDPYLGEVAAADRYLGPLLNPFLDGDEPAALVLVTADHGESLGEHGEATHGLFAYEATLHVPLIVWAPGLEPTRHSAPARHVDVLPTLLEAAGVKGPADLPGRSLLEPPRADDGEVSYFESLSAALDRGWAPLRGVIADGKKLIELPLIELYDLETDPAELDNLADRERRQLAALRAQLPKASNWPPDRTASTDAEERAALRSLGYSAGSAVAAKRAFSDADDPKRLVGVDQAVHRFIELFERGRLVEATDVARQVVIDQPRMELARENLAQVLLERRLLGDAVDVMQAAVHDGAAGPPLVRQLALTHLERGETKSALEVIEPLAGSRDPDDRNVLGVVLAEAGRLAEARRVLESVFVLDPTNPEAHQHLALVALKSDDWPAAATAAQAAIEGNSRLHHAWNYLGVARVNLGRPREAITAWKRAAELVPDDLDLIFNIAMVAIRLGDRGEATRALEQFVQQAPADRYGPDIARAQAQLRAWRSSP